MERGDFTTSLDGRRRLAESVNDGDKTPDYHLRVAVLECAVKDYLAVRDVRDWHWETARAWLFDDEQPEGEYIRLIDVAEAIELDVETIRQRVRLIEAGELRLWQRKR